MNNDDGYQQAIDNIAYEIDRMSEVIHSSSSNLGEAVVSMTTRSGSYDLIAEDIPKLDHIFEVVAKTYHKTEAEIDRDVTAALARRIIKLIT